MRQTLRDRLDRATEQLQSRLVASTESGVHLWAADLGDAFFTVGHALRLFLDAERRSRDLSATCGPDWPVQRESQDFRSVRRRLREEFLLEIVDGLETELHNRRLRMVPSNEGHCQDEVAALRELGHQLLEALRTYQAEDVRFGLVPVPMNHFSEPVDAQQAN